MSQQATSAGSRWSVRLTAPALLVIGILIALAGGSETRPPLEGLPLLVLFWVMAINVIAWIPAYFRQTERFYDLIGSVSFISSAFLVGLWTQPGIAGWIMLTCVIIWSARMAWFLVGRIHKQGKDGRFDEFKVDPVRFLNAWTMQAMWAFLCLLPVLVRLDHSPEAGFSAVFWAGLTVWLIGFGVEVVADEQKKRFRAIHPDGSQFITSGLWSISRHPNYVGEITLWFGVMLMAAPVVSGWQWIILISPLFVYVLLRFISGVPLLERRSDEKWGGQPDYEAYKQGTPILFPGPWGRG